MNKGMNLLIPLLLTLVATVAFGALAASFNSQIDKEKEDIEKQEKINSKLKGEIKDLMEETINLRAYINGSKDDSAVDTKEVERAYLKRSSTLMSTDYRGERKESKAYDTYVSAFKDLFDEIDSLQKKIADAQNDAKKVLEELGNERKRYGEHKVTSDKSITELRNQKEEIHSRLNRIIQERETERDEYKGKFEEANRQKELLRDQYEQVAIPKLKIEIASLSEVIDKLEETIRRRKKIEGLDPDGEIIAVNQDLGYVWLNIGRIHGLRKGLIFRTFEYIKGGKRNFKGKIEVIKVENDMSQAKIIQQLYKKEPMIKGDYVLSPIFDRNQKKVFVFAGQRAYNRLYSAEKYKKMLEEYNQVVDDQVSGKADFLILLEGYEESKEYKDCKNFPWIIFLREEDLLDFLKR